jgi:hypothetical protein
MQISWELPRFLSKERKKPKRTKQQQNGSEDEGKPEEGICDFV